MVSQEGSHDLAGRGSDVTGSLARTGIPSPLSSAVYDAGNRLTQWSGTNFTYDTNGNLINDGVNTYTWNARNQLTSITGGTSANFQYDAFGRRVTRNIAGTARNLLYDGGDTVQELTGSSPSANMVLGGVDESFTRNDSSGVSSFLLDALGSTVALTDSTGTVQTQYTYEPFGKTSITGQPTTNADAFTGRENDATGLYFYRSRYYNPTLQRFISEDPIGMGGGPNQYAYVSNCPLDYGDPSGKIALEGCAYGVAIYVDFVLLPRLLTSRKPPSWQEIALEAGKQCVIGELTEGVGNMLEVWAELGLVAELAEGEGLLAGSVRDVNAVRGTMNCVNCAIATDVTLAGNPASATPGGATRISELENFFGGSFQPVSGEMQVGSILSQAGDGARGIVYGDSMVSGDAGHIWNAINNNGNINFIDGQLGGGGLNNFNLFQNFRFLLTFP